MQVLCVHEIKFDRNKGLDVSTTFLGYHVGKTKLLNVKMRKFFDQCITVKLVEEAELCN